MLDNHHHYAGMSHAPQRCLAHLVAWLDCCNQSTEVREHRGQGAALAPMTTTRGERREVAVDAKRQSQSGGFRLRYQAHTRCLYREAGAFRAPPCPS